MGCDTSHGTIYDATRSKTPDEVLTAAYDWQELLDSGETLSGTPTVTNETGGTLTVASPAVNGVAIKVNRIDVAAGKAVTFSVSGGAAGTTYRLAVQCGTTASQTIKRHVYVDVVAVKLPDGSSP